MDELMGIAARIRGLRESCGYSREHLANELGIDLETYSSYEECGINIPISVIFQIAGKFGVDFTEIITGTSAKLSTYHLVKKGEGNPIDRYPGYSFSDLAFRYSHKIMQPLLVTLEPTNKKPELITHSGQEFNMVLEGSMVVYFEDKELVLNVGDSLYFNPSHPHGQKCLGDEKTVFLTVITN
jgi:transcriptional regulator with XRE-family HTH domain